MAKVGFHRSDRQHIVFRAIFAKRFRQRGCLDRVSDSGAGAVGLDKTNIARINACVFARIPHKPRLSLGAR